jgi:superfamily I DNA/RNA helicase
LLPQAVAYEVENETEEYILKIYEKYQKQLEEANALDFDDLLLLPYTLFKLKPEILDKWHKQFKHILVDEAQDTNWIQFELIKMLSYGKDYFKLFSTGSNSENLPNKSSVLINNASIVTFIGDDFQSIYGRRGAVMENFLNVAKRWPNIKIFKLEINYRSLPHIVEAGNAIIKYNLNQYKKTIKPNKTGSATVKVFIR